MVFLLRYGPQTGPKVPRGSLQSYAGWASWSGLRPRQRLLKPAFEDLLIRVEPVQKTHPLAVSLKRGLGNEAYQLGAGGLGVVAAGLLPDRGVGFAHRCAGKVGDIHGDLGLALRGDAHGFDAGESAARVADVAGDGAGDSHVGGVEEEIEGDEEFARADGGGSGGGMQRGSADIGAAGRLAKHGVAEAFKLAAADLFQHGAIGTGGGGFVEIDGDLVAPPDLRAGLAGEQRALLQRNAADGDKGDDVSGADAGMDAGLGGEVDEFGGPAGSTNGGFDHGG